MATEVQRSTKVGKLRPSQVVTQHGPGSVVDLPELSVIMAGLNYWYPGGGDRVFEPRLEAFLRVRALYRPPQPGPGKFGGLPAFLFPEWLVCPRCRKLAPHTEFHFRVPPGEFICTREDQRHGRGSPSAFPARFMVACAAGHLDDFPWSRWAHGSAQPCGDALLELIDTGSSGSASDLVVRCTRCNANHALGGAFYQGAVDPCSGRRPWLSRTDHQSGCQETPRTILRGASNAYFAVVASALSIPPWSDPIQQDLAAYRERLMQAASLDKLKAGIEGGFYDVGDLLERHTVEAIWRALSADAPAEVDLKRREYVAFQHPEARVEGRAEFEIAERTVPSRVSPQVDMVVAATRLREVRALRGFTRLDSNPDLGERTDVSELNVRLASIGLKGIDWLPAIDLRGEGIFLRVSEVALCAWEATQPVRTESARLAAQYREWRTSRALEDRPFPGMRYVLLHTLAHTLIRQLCLDSGYSSSALRERVYCADGDDPMSGILIYTATADSDGSLGGLVDQAAPERLGPVMLSGMDEARYCASDPLCGARAIDANTNLNGAACHACLLLPETCCEFGNRLLDRAVVVETLGDRGIAFFESS